MQFTRAEIEAALINMDRLRAEASSKGDWRIWAECLSDDVEFHDSLHGGFSGKEDVADFVVRVHAPFPNLRYQRLWTMIDVDQAEILFHQQMILPEPEGYSGPPFAVDVWSRHRYAGDNLFSFKQDVTLSSEQANSNFKVWMAAGGKFLAEPLKPATDTKKTKPNE